MNSEDAKNLHIMLTSINVQLGAITRVQALLLKSLTDSGHLNPTAARVAVVDAIKSHAQHDNPQCDIWRQAWEAIRSSLPQ